MRSDYSRGEQLTHLTRHPVYLEPDDDGDECLGDELMMMVMVVMVMMVISLLNTVSLLSSVSSGS